MRAIEKRIRLVPPVWGGIEDPRAAPCSAQRGVQGREKGSALSNISKEEQDLLTDWEQQMGEQQVSARTLRFLAQGTTEIVMPLSEKGKPEGGGGLWESC